MKLRYKIVSGVAALLVAAIGSLALVIAHTDECSPAPAISDGKPTMNAIVHRCYGSPDVLSYEAVEKPEPGDGELLVRVEAAGVNPLDSHYMRGSPYLMRLASGLGKPDDIRLGVDFAGTVEAVGDGVTGFQQGDAVFGGGSGAYAEYLVISADGAVARKPDNISFAEAAAVPIAGVTALQAIRDKGQLEAGQRVLINGASGGVGTFAVQIAKSLGAHVVGVCSTRNVDMVLGLGADRVIDYTKENYTDSDERFDLIIDMVGNHSARANVGVLAPGGRMVNIGGPKGNWIGPLLRPLESLAVSPFVDPDLMSMVAILRQQDLELLAELMQTRTVEPKIDRHFALRETADAIRYSETRRASGKIIIDTVE